MFFGSAAQTCRSRPLEHPLSHALNTARPPTGIPQFVIGCPRLMLKASTRGPGLYFAARYRLGSERPKTQHPDAISMKAKRQPPWRRKSAVRQWHPVKCVLVPAKKTCRLCPRSRHCCRRRPHAGKTHHGRNFGERHARERRRPAPARRRRKRLGCHQDRRGCRPHEGMFGAVIIGTIASGE